MKKGFTLIELLAVIVILAIIALIVTPVVSNIVANARIAANARSVEGHIRNIELAIITKAFGETSTGDLDSYDTITSGTNIESSLSRAGNDNVTCESYVIKHGTVLSAGGCKDTENKWGEKYSYNNNEGAYVFQFNGTVILPSLDGNGNPTQNKMTNTLSLPMVDSEGNSIVTYKGIVYMDPTNVKAVCNEDSEITNTNAGCKKFYIYKEDGTNYYMIMDRNLGNSIEWANHDDYIAAGGTENEWNGMRYNTQGPVSAVPALENRTTNWIGNPRMITANEIVAIVKKTGWDSATATYNDVYFGSKNTTGYSSQSEAQQATQQSYHWLFDYTNGCTSYGCKIASTVYTTGYWTTDTVSGRVNYVWEIDNFGRLGYLNAGGTGNGIRPVLEIPKSLIG